MRNDQQPIRLAGIERHPLGRGLQRESRPAEDEKVEVELARPPALALPTPEGTLELLERDQERGRASGRIGTGGHVERDDRVAEERLIDHPDRLGDIQAGHRVQADARQRRQSANAARERVVRVAEVRPEPDVRPNAPQVVPPDFPTLSRVTDVAVLILHPTPPGRAGELETWVAAARGAIAERHRAGFLAAGAADVTVVAGPPDGRRFGSRLTSFLTARRPDGVVVLGSGAIPLATLADRRAFVEAAAADRRMALANNHFSADVVAIALARSLPAVDDLESDNALPRRLGEEAGYEVDDLRDRWRLGFDIDGPLDLLLLGRRSWLPAAPDGIVDRVIERLAGVGRVSLDPHAELVVMGRLSAGELAWLERSTASRTRALIEERGFRTRVVGQRPARSTLGMLLDREGPDALGAILGELGDAAMIDTRVLLAHRFGADEGAWPAAQDRFASDLLLVDRIADPWLRALTRAGRDAAMPVVLGGHSLVGPGLRLALGEDRSWT
jgi:hypothetical protein